MGQKFAMEADALVRQHQKTSGHHDDLIALVGRLADSASEMDRDHNGEAKAAFNQFKARTDDVAARLSNALGAVDRTIAEQNNSFVAGAEEGAAVHQHADAAANFTAAVTKDV